MAKLLDTFTVDYENGKDWREHNARVDKELAALVTRLKAESEDELVGQEIRWQRADGYARYLVAETRPLRLIHLNIGDGWTVEAPLIRGLRLDDVKAMVERDRRIAQLWASRDTAPGE